jgi:hypothetical protein
MKPSLFIALPCYDSVTLPSLVSIIKLIQHLGKKNIEVTIHAIKSPLIHQARNHLVSVFLTTTYQYLLFVDSDVEFEPEAVMKMMEAKKNIICTPYRLKSPEMDKHIYSVQVKDSKILPGGLVELATGPTGLMLIDRKVFKKIIKNHPELKIKNKITPNAGKSHEFYYNFFYFSFEDQCAMGEDVSFCRLARSNDFKIYANIKSQTGHYGSLSWKGTFGERLYE